jgi:hypothetical protein
MNYYENDIASIRGDTFSHALVVEGMGVEEFESVYFTVRDSLNDDSNILLERSLYNGISLIEYDSEKDIRKYMVRIEPEDTKDIQAGTYYYDEQVAVNGDVFTIMKGRFILKQDITRKTVTPVNPDEWIDLYLDKINGEVIDYGND